MGADIKQLRIRIKSVDSTLHLTAAMGLVASSKIRRASENMQKSAKYRSAVEEMIRTLARSRECAKSPYMAEREGNRTRLVVIAGDRGMAGGYNANVFRLLSTLGQAETLPIGKRACDRLGGELRLAEDFTFADARTLAEELCLDFAAGKFDRLGILCTHYVSMMKQEPQVLWVLPLVAGEGDTSLGTVFEPDERTVLEAAVPGYVAGVLYAAVKESFASEVAARRVAMDSAGKNAAEMLDKLGLAYNRARQGSITQEITEIVAGSGQ